MLQRVFHPKTIFTKRTARSFGWRNIAFLFLSVVLLTFDSNTVRVLAVNFDCPKGMSTIDCQAIWNDWTGWVPDSGVNCTSTSGGVTSGSDVVVPPGQNTGTWTSSLAGPYTLEQFMIEVLKDIAHKRGASETDAVTQQHVIGLLALAWGEGGGITNNDFWNPFNTGINAPDLTVGGEHVGNGVQAFKSFDAGVEATARVMTGSTQGRLGITLTNSNANAIDFLNSWLDFPPKAPYPVGHYPWAEASDPSSPYFEPEYRSVREKLIQQVTKDYDNIASTIMRGQASDPKDKHDTSKLRYHADGSVNSAANGGQACTCGSADGSNVIVIDPGHNLDDSYAKNGNKDVLDPATGLKDYDYANFPELDEVFNVAAKVRDKLTQDGYKVLMTKDSARSNANKSPTQGSFRARADMANNAHAALAISIHDQSGKDGLPFATANNYVYVQKVGAHRDKADGTPVRFTNQEIANKSAAYGQIFADERTKAEGHKVTVTDANIDRGPRFSPGNIWMVQLFSNVPWIYNEVGGDSAGQDSLSEADQTKYANGLVASVEKAVPLNGASAGSAATSSTCGSGTFFDTAKAYAWPQYHSAPYCLPKPEYKVAVQAAVDRIKSGKNDYVGGASLTVPGDTESCSGGHAGIDCGGFVTRVFRDSGADPKYNERLGPVTGQYAYVSSHPDLYQRIDANKSGDLHPGDIFFSSSLGHTYIFVGEMGYPGYNSVSASFSTTGRSWRTPMASVASNSDISGGTWYRPLFALTGEAATHTGTGHNTTPND